MDSRFKSVPIEADTKIKAQSVLKLGDYEVLYQKWFWDGITAESIIFDGQDVASLTDAEIVAQVRTSPLVMNDSKITISRSYSGFVFTNFNFTY